MVYSVEPLEKATDKSSETLHKQIVQRIRNWIHEGRLKVGDPLPSERELAQIFDVSRVPVREALKTLDFMGALEHVRGKGVFIRKIDMNQVLSNIDFLMADPVHTLLDLFEAREAIELQATRLAAERRTEEDLSAMRSVINEMEQNIHLGKDVYEESMKFHSAVMVAAHNSVFLMINEFLAAILAYSRKQSLQNPGRHELALDYHKKIMHKIIAQDADGAVAVMSKHLQDAKNVIIKMGEKV